MIVRQFLCVLVILFSLVACATPYQPFGAMGGYSENKTGEDTFTVSYYGNHFTFQDRMYSLTLYRSAVLTMHNGFDYFEVLSRNYVTLTNPSAVYNRSTVTAGGYRRAIFTIKMYRGAPAEQGDNIYVASQVIKDLAEVAKK